MKTALLPLLLIFTGVCFGQETQVKILPQANILVLDKEKGEKTNLGKDYPGFTEAKLFQINDSLYALEIYYEQDQRLSKFRQILTEEEKEMFQVRMYETYFAGQEKEELDQNGRALLVTGSSIVGLAYYGYALPLTLNIDNDKPFIAMYMLTAGGSFLLPYSLTKQSEVTRGQGSMAFWGQTRGIYHGIALAQVITDFPEIELALGLGITGSILEGLVNFNLAKYWNYNSGSASMYQMGGDVGNVGGLLLADAFGLYNNDSPSVVFLTSLLGTATGLMGGKSLADTREYTVGDALYFRSSIVLGSYLGLSLVNLAEPEKSVPYTMSAFLGGAAGGLYAYYRLKNVNFTTGQGVLTAMGELAGGLVGFGLGYLLVDDLSNSQIPLMTSSIGAGVVFGLLTSKFAPKAEVMSDNLNLQISLNPLGFYQPKKFSGMNNLPGLYATLTF